MHFIFIYPRYFITNCAMDKTWYMTGRAIIFPLCWGFFIISIGTFDKTVEESAHYFNTCFMLLRGGI